MSGAQPELVEAAWIIAASVGIVLVSTYLYDGARYIARRRRPRP